MAAGSELVVRISGWELGCCQGPISVGTVVEWPLVFGEHFATDHGDEVTPTGELLDPESRAPYYDIGGVHVAVRSEEGTPALHQGPIWAEAHNSLSLPGTRATVLSVEIATVAYDLTGERHYTPSPDAPVTYRAAEPDHPWVAPKAPEPERAPEHRRELPAHQRGDSHARVRLRVITS